MHKEQFLKQRKSKFLTRGEGPFQILERINDNTYKLNLLGEYNMSATFNASNLSSFYTSTWDEAYLDPIDMNPVKKSCDPNQFSPKDRI